MDLSDLISEAQRSSSEGKPIVVDLETTGLNWQKDHIRGIGIGFSPADVYFTEANEDHFEDFLFDLLQIPATFIFHNAKFDLHFLRPFGDPENVEDTMIQGSLIDENIKHDLLGLSKIFISESADYYNVQFREFLKINKIKDFSVIPIEMLMKKCVEDVSNTYSLYNIFSKRIGLEELSEVYLLEKALLKVLVLMEHNGCPVDKAYLSEISKNMEQQASLLQKEFPSSLNLGSSSQVAKYLFGDLKLTPIAFTPKKKQAAAGEEILAQFNLPVTDNILKWRSLMHTKAFAESLLERADSSGEVHCEFRQLGTRTGRLSCVDPNLQQMPTKSEIRRAFGRGNIVIFDYSQMEAMLFAHFSKDPILIKLFSEGVDAYEAVASRMYNISFEETRNRNSFYKDARTFRDVSKSLFLGYIYGMGEGKSERITGSDEAYEILGRQFSRFKEYRDEVDNQLREFGYVRTVLRRKRRLLPHEFYKGINAIIQGSAADILKLVMVSLPHEIQVKMINNVHDELMFRDLIAEEIEEIRGIMTNFNFSVPLRVEIGIGRNWLEADEDLEA